MPEVHPTMGSSCKGRVAVVTGGSRGIGRAIALRLAAEGAAVAIVARQGERFGRSIEATVDELRASGRPAISVVADLTDPADSREAIIDRVETELGPVDILVNNAAMSGFKPFTEWTDKQLRAMQEVNNWAPWQLTRRVLPGMLERGEGWIANISSGAASAQATKLVGGVAYGGTKAMLNQWTRCLAVELVDQGIVANSLTPAAASRTEVVEQLLAGDAAAAASRGVRAENTEPLEVMAEATLALCTLEPGVLVGEFLRSVDLLVHLGRPVHDLEGKQVLDGYGVEDLAGIKARIDAMTRTSIDGGLVPGVKGLGG